MRLFLIRPTANSSVARDEEILVEESEMDLFQMELVETNLDASTQVDKLYSARRLNTCLLLLSLYGKAYEQTEAFKNQDTHINIHVQQNIIESVCVRKQSRVDKYLPHRIFLTFNERIFQASFFLVDES